MKRNLAVAGALLSCSTAAVAGGLDRTGQSIAVIFENGTYAELSYSFADPSVSGVGVFVTPGTGSGDMISSHSLFSGAYKQSLGNGFDVALIFDQPFGANVLYPTSAYFASGSTAKLETSALTALVKYTTSSAISVYGGLRYQTLSADTSIPFVLNYEATSNTDGALGYVIGGAYEMPEIALRIALTYNSEIKHKLDTTEYSLAFGTNDSVTPINTPQSLNLEAQTGIAPDTLLFGTVRWVDWSEFEIDPPYYPPAEPIVFYNKDMISYALGIGRKFNETWSSAVTLGYEAPIGGFASNLGPTDGYASIGLGATYTHEQLKVTMGVRYVDIGDAETTIGGGLPAAEFSDNSAIGFGLRVGYTF